MKEMYVFTRLKIISTMVLGSLSVLADSTAIFGINLLCGANRCGVLRVDECIAVALIEQGHVFCNFVYCGDKGLVIGTAMKDKGASVCLLRCNVVK